LRRKSMALVRWDPLHEMKTLARRMERMFEPMTSYTETPYTSDSSLTRTGEYWPAVDIYEDKEEIYFRAEMPGMDRKNIELLIEDTTLTLRGERHLEKEEKKEYYHRVESAYGAFSRSFTLPASAERDRIRAEMKDGVLHIHVPKREGAKGKAITISG
jgi:HSP20 family protein